jgi:hypothetical protein
MTTPSTTTKEHHMTPIQLTPAQHAILAYAVEHTGGKIEWFPDNIRGSARTKVLEGLFNKALITRDSTKWFVAAEGYDALGMKRPAILPPTPSFEAELDKIIASAEAKWKEEAQTAPRTRANSKQALVIEMLRRPEGATIGQICAATGWQAHTVRGTFAGALKKKLGLTLTSEKPEGGERIYRIG